MRVEAGARVTNSVLLFDTIVEPGAVLDKTITDVEVRIGAESIVGDSEDFTANREFPDLLNSGITLIGRGVEMPKRFHMGRNCIVYPTIKEKGFADKKIPSGMITR